MRNGGEVQMGIERKVRWGWEWKWERLFGVGEGTHRQIVIILTG